MMNSLAMVHPELISEWSDTNILKPTMVTAYSNQKAWLKCKECGHEWKSVVASRIKGTNCPACADRKVHSGYNDLATTDRYLLRKRDCELNTGVLPTQISRNSMRSVLWRCSNGHSWKAKIFERTIEDISCTICESEYRSVFPQLIIGFYTRMKGLNTLLNYDKVIGIPLETYVPEENLAIESVTL